MILLLAGPLGAQGETGFTRGEGRADVVFSFGQDDYEEEPLFPGNELEVRRITYSTYAAVGLTDDIDLVLQKLIKDCPVQRGRIRVSLST